MISSLHKSGLDSENGILVELVKNFRTLSEQLSRKYFNIAINAVSPVTQTFSLCSRLFIPIIISLRTKMIWLYWNWISLFSFLPILVRFVYLEIRICSLERMQPLQVWIRIKYELSYSELRSLFPFLFNLGWGRLSENGQLPSRLQHVTVPIISNAKCRELFLKSNRVEHIPDIFLCAGYEKGDRIHAKEIPGTRAS